MKVYFFGGKGGVGKTTLSSAYAVKLSEEGKKVLLISTDPAHSLSDVFNIPIDGEAKINEKLTLKEIDIQKSLKDYTNRVFELSRALLKPESLKQLEGILHSLEESPGIEDTVILEELTKEIVYKYEDYDAFVIDTAPTGHTLGLLKTVGRLSSFFEEVIKMKAKLEELKKASGKEYVSRSLEYIEERKKRFEKFSKIVYTSSEFIPVLTPEKLPIEETTRLIKSLEHKGIKVRRIIVNKVLPQNLKDEFSRKRRENQERYIKEIEERFKKLERIYIPLRETDIVGYEELKKLSSLLF
ncbi:TRC40/GET3/ArsA family transport-energizing ATPase [Aquifex pyrophilus]